MPTGEAQLDVARFRNQGRGRGHLRHGAMKRGMPTGVISGVTGATGIGGHVIAFLGNDRAVGGRHGLFATRRLPDERSDREHTDERCGEHPPAPFSSSRVDRHLRDPADERSSFQGPTEIARRRSDVKLHAMADDRWWAARFARGKSEHQTAACRAKRAGAVGESGAATESVTENIRPDGCASVVRQR